MKKFIGLDFTYSVVVNFSSGPQAIGYVLSEKKQKQLI